MKKLAFCIYFIFLIVAISAQDRINLFNNEIDVYNYKNPGFPNPIMEKRISLTNEKMRIYNKNYSEKHEEYPITWEIINKNYFITFNYTGVNFGNNVSHGIKKYLVLSRVVLIGDRQYSDYIALYDNNNELVMEVSRFDKRMGDFTISATSELKENSITYTASNLFDTSHLTPWVEGVNGNGVGEKITQTIGYNDSAKTYYLIISNGFVNNNKPYLYEYNNRVKAVKIYPDDKVNDFVIINIEDTPNIQCIEFIFKGYCRKSMTIEIMEVYPGSHYDDTCINYLEINGY
ncbi:hypothetical protein FACS1894110_23130 [Spirochaetia bacterium]|nr:hypothetical protein FACS1894110_23130 [Spirochaetia bacterium]